MCCASFGVVCVCSIASSLSIVCVCVCVCSIASSLSIVCVCVVPDLVLCLYVSLLKP